MSHRLLLPFTLSAALHAAALAAVLASWRAEEERAVLTVDVAWEPSASHSSSMSPSGLTRGPSSDPSAGGTVSHGDIAAGPLDQLRGRAIGEDERSPKHETAHPTRAAASPTPPREITETPRSSRRRQAVAVRPIDSKKTESYSESGAPASAVASALASHEQLAAHGEQGSGVGLADAADTSASGASASAEKGGEAVHRVEPGYPMAARRRGLEGSVILRVRFDAEGRPEDVVVTRGSGSEMLDHAAREAVLRWRFRGGSAGFVDVPITFRLRGAEAVQVSEAGTGRAP